MLPAPRCVSARSLCRRVTACFLLTLSATAAPADEPAASYRRSLFNGENLDGWTVTGCEAAAENGLLVLKDGNGFLQSQHRYRDFVLELQWKPRRDQAWDSGVYIRCEPPTGERPWPKQYQINLKQNDEANLNGFPAGRSTGVVRPGEWNAMKVTVVGSRVAMEINGQPAWQCDGLTAADGFIGFQAEVPGGGQFEFKEIFLTELGHRSVFNGQDLTGWEGSTGEATCWKVDGNLLVCTGEKGPWLRSQQEYDDFNLRLEYKLREAGNSGVYVRVPQDGNHHGDGAGVEIQILDDAAERYTQLKPYQFTGSVYAIVAADPRVSRPAGEWNTLEIDCRGTSYQVRHNGAVVIQANAEGYPELGGRRLAGYLGLQNHSEEVWFRHLRLGPSQQPEPPPAEQKAAAQ